MWCFAGIEYLRSLVIGSACDWWLGEVNIYANFEQTINNKVNTVKSFSADISLRVSLLFERLILGFACEQTYLRLVGLPMRLIVKRRR